MTTRGDSTRRAPSPRVRVLCAAAVAVAMALLAGRSLLADGFFNAHDNLLNVHRLFEMDRCVADGQLPCRWAPDMGAGYGAPVFNFYPPLPTFVAEGFRVFGANTLDAVKWAFLLALIISGVGMFRLASSFFGVGGGVVASVLYVFAPYQAILVFVRGALGEAWGLALLPWVFPSPMPRAVRSLAGRGRLAIRAPLGCRVRATPTRLREPTR